MQRADISSGLSTELTGLCEPYIQPELPLIHVELIGNDTQTETIVKILKLPLPRFNSRGEADGYSWTAYI